MVVSRAIIGLLVSRFLSLSVLVYWFLGFLGFLVSWFLELLVSKFLGSKVSWFQSFLGFLVSKSQSFNDPTLPSFHFIVSGRDRSHIEDFQEFIRRIFEMCRAPSFTSIRIAIF